jgi:hypothetical protein
MVCREESSTFQYIMYLQHLMMVESLKRHTWGISSDWLEHLICTQKVKGSTPLCSTEGTVLEFLIEHLSDDENYPIGSIKKFTRGSGDNG